MSASRNLASNTNVARAMSGAIVVVVAGGTVATHGDSWHRSQTSPEDGESSSAEQQQQQQQPPNHKKKNTTTTTTTTTTAPLLGSLSRGSSLPFSPSSLPQPPMPSWSSWYHDITSRGPTMVSSCDERRFFAIATDPSYPDFSRFGPASYLKKHLTPGVYTSLRDKTTTNGVTLEDVIRSGVSLPWGSKPPRGTGVYAGDEESYHVFAELLVPIIEDYHRYHFAAGSSSSTVSSKKGGRGSSSTTTTTTTARNYPVASSFLTAMSPAMSSLVLENDDPMHGHSSKKNGIMLRRQFTNLNRNSVLEQKLDPTGDYILQTRMRVARSIKGFPFSPVISRAQRRELERLFERMVDEDWNSDDDENENEDEDDYDFEFSTKQAINTHGGLRDGKYLRLMEMSNEQHDDLIHRHILFHDPDEYNISAGIGRDWPDARGIYLSSSTPNNQQCSSSHTENPDLMIWLNKEDHMRIIATSNGGDLPAVFGRLSKALTQVEQSLHKRGHAFCVHPRYGFVNASPENLGTALRASVYIKLYRLGQQPGFEDLLYRLRLESSSRFKDNTESSSSPSGAALRYTGIFDIANSERLGQSEVQLINTMINGVGRLIELEKRLEKGEKVNLDEVR